MKLKTILTHFFLKIFLTKHGHRVRITRYNIKLKKKQKDGVGLREKENEMLTLLNNDKLLYVYRFRCVYIERKKLGRARVYLLYDSKKKVEVVPEISSGFDRIGVM